jgi:hypothetical protein
VKPQPIKSLISCRFLQIEASISILQVSHCACTAGSGVWGLQCSTYMTAAKGAGHLLPSVRSGPAPTCFSSSPILREKYMETGMSLKVVLNFLKRYCTSWPVTHKPHCQTLNKLKTW